MFLNRFQLYFHIVESNVLSLNYFKIRFHVLPLHNHHLSLFQHAKLHFSAWLTRHQMTFHPDEDADQPITSEPNFDDSLFNQYFPISGRKPGRPPITQPRSFKCKDCGKVFQKRRKLTSHAKIHRFILIFIIKTRSIVL